MSLISIANGFTSHLLSETSPERRGEETDLVIMNETGPVNVRMTEMLGCKDMEHSERLL